MTSYLDGNMLGGALGELFAVDVTVAVGTCASCGTARMLSEAEVYPDAPGLVARCPACGAVILRVVRADDRAWLDLTGIRSLQLPVPSASPAP